jgi:hypothetical protein
MTPEMYDEVSPELLESIKKQPGFILHVAFVDKDGFCAAEIWETQEHHDTWFNANVVPNVPVEIAQEVIEVHNVVQP